MDSPIEKAFVTKIPNKELRSESRKLMGRKNRKQNTK